MTKKGTQEKHALPNEKIIELLKKHEKVEYKFINQLLLHCLLFNNYFFKFWVEWNNVSYLQWYVFFSVCQQHLR